MVLHLTDEMPSDEIQRIILHEFGHVLGLAHEQQHPRYRKVMAKFLDEFAMWESAKQSGLKSYRDFRQQYLGLKRANGAFLQSKYCDSSIMHYM